MSNGPLRAPSWIHCKSLWIKMPTECINVCNVMSWNGVFNFTRSISVNHTGPWSAETQTLGQTKRDCVLREERVMGKRCFVLRSFLSCFKGSLSFPSAFLLRAQQVHSSCRQISPNTGFSLLDRLLRRTSVYKNDR